jgi:hypothetical protein
MQAMDRKLAIRAALTQAAGVAVLSIALAIALPHSFFDDYGWIVGPGAWALCALVTAHLLGLAKLWTLLGAAVAGVPSLVGVLLGAHWLGALVAIAVFAAWCGFSGARSTGRPLRFGTPPAPGPAGPGAR